MADNTQDIPDASIVRWTDTSDDVPMVDTHVKVLTSHSGYSADVETLATANTYTDTKARKAWVSGALKTGAYPYLSKATTSSGTATFWLTTDGTSAGAAVFNNIYADSIAVVIYGNSANYQPFSPVVAGDKKSVTVSVNQTTSVLLGLLQLVSASNGVDVRLLVVGD